MDEKGIDPKEISGTGAGGKITKEDVIEMENYQLKKCKEELLQLLMVVFLDL